MSTSYDTLVVGAGIGGIRAALDLAETGRKVALIDSRPHIGGLLAQLDHQFPSDHCGMCRMLPLTERESSSQFCMRKGFFHRNIDIHLNTELTSLEGEPGTFKAVLAKQSSFVDPNKCIGCGLCAQACPVTVPSDFNAGLSMRTAVHLPVPHSIPNHYVVDMDACERCWQCHAACPTGAIDFRFDERRDFAILVVSPREDALERLNEWFADQNFPFRHATSGQQALDMVAKDDTLRLAVIDVRIGDEDGALDAERILERIQELRPDLPVVAACPQEREHEGRALVDLGARDYVLGPYDQAALVPWLDKLYMRLVSEERMELDVAAVVLAAGFECYDPGNPATGTGQTLGYGTLPGVVTSLEFERMCSSSGPTGGKLTRHDGKPLSRIAWLQCVGSRDVQKNAGFCSSICCMISLKEANLALKRTRTQQDDPAECTVFYMDMRVFGKQYQSYRDRAERNGVRFVPARLHTVLPSPDDPGALRVQYVTDDGRITEEPFDMLVLAVGARPPKAMQRLAKAADIETNEWGFVQTDYFEPARTSRVGVFAGGSFGQPRDIAESVIQSGAAACNASRLVNLFAPIKEREPDAKPEYRDVSREPARVLVALCRSCPTLDTAMDVEALAQRLESTEGVARVIRVDSACTGAGWDTVAEAAAEIEPNRVLIGACMPYSYVPRLRELGARIGLDPSLMDVVDVHTGAMGPQAETVNETLLSENDAFTRLHMSLMRLLGADPSPLPPPQEVTRAALVVGGGLAGLTSAMAIADHGYPVTLVEEAEHLGGTAMQLRRTLDGRDPVRFMEDLVGQVDKHPNITVYTEARVVLSMGRAGRFLSVVSTDSGSLPLEHGATLLATGGRESRIYDYGFRVHKSVLTQLELEQRLASGEIDASALKGVAMIQCWRSREENRNYCSRVCCSSMLKNLLLLKERNPDLPVYVFYRDIMSYGFSESYYTRAREAGAIFIRHTPDNRPEVAFEDARPVITAYDPVLAAPVRVRTDLLVLSTGMEPNENGELAEIFGVSLDENGFFNEADYKWRPVDFIKQGVFVCGVARAPGTMGESVASAKAAAQRAVRLLSEKRLTCGPVVAEVRDSLCSRCGKCIDVCPYEARTLDMDHDRIVVDELLCQGCGSCAAACPNGASVLRGFTDRQVMSVIDAALDNLPGPARSQGAHTESEPETDAAAEPSA